MTRQQNSSAGLPIEIVGSPTAESDAAVARFLERFLAAERPGTTWIVSPSERAA